MANLTDNVLTGIGGPLERVCLDWRAHLAASMNSDPLELPDCLADRLANASTIDSVADDLAQLFNLMTHAIHTGGYDYIVSTHYLSEDNHNLTCGTVRLDLFSRTNGYHTGDGFYTSDGFLVVDLDKVYAFDANDNLAECGLLDATVGFWLSPLRDNYDATLLEPLNDRLSVGYSSYPYGELESHLTGGEWYLRRSASGPSAHLIKKAYWSESRKCYVCRVDCAPYVCRIDPIAPCYGG